MAICADVNVLVFETAVDDIGIPTHHVRDVRFEVMLYSVGTKCGPCTVVPMGKVHLFVYIVHGNFTLPNIVHTVKSNYRV